MEHPFWLVLFVTLLPLLALAAEPKIAENRRHRL